MNIEDLLRHSTETVGNLSNDRLVFVRNKNLHSILHRFDKEEHRLEFVTKFRGITFINDAKANCLNALYYSLETIKQKIVWITAANNDVIDYTEVSGLVLQKVKAIVCVGECASSIKHAFDKHIPQIYERLTMEEAVITSFYIAEENETVLLSSANTYDKSFKDYTDMGTQFRNAIAQL